VLDFTAAAQVSGLSASTLLNVIPQSGKSFVKNISDPPYKDCWTSMWSPDLSNVSSVELIAAMPLAVTTAAFVFSKAAIFAASTCIVWIACLAAIHDLNKVLSFQ